MTANCPPNSGHGKDLESWGMSDPFHYAVATSPGAAFSQRKLIYLLWDRTLGRGWDLDGPARTTKDPLSSRLPREMMTRVNAAMPPILGEVPRALRAGKTWEMALWLDLWNWPKNKLLGNPVTTKAESLATTARLPIDIVYVPALWKPVLLDPAPYPPGSEPWADFDWLWQTRPSENEPPEALQQKCLGQVLDQTETKAMPAARLAAVDAWARGDLEHALKRSNGVQLCLMGDLPSTSARDFELRQARLYIEQLDRAFETKGESVALVEFDPLLLETGGVLDHYRALGFSITTGDGME
ncbi:MAG: hypothetical protein JWM33_1885, partial [Caulobacteraceae bacterium]|nr:hypothetical protein [Caulobacteraceae bacterium]